MNDHVFNNPPYSIRESADKAEGSARWTYNLTRDRQFDVTAFDILEISLDVALADHPVWGALRVCVPVLDPLCIDRVERYPGFNVL
jgi:hypothetical protein